MSSRRNNYKTKEIEKVLDSININFEKVYTVKFKGMEEQVQLSEKSLTKKQLQKCNEFLKQIEKDKKPEKKKSLFSKEEEKQEIISPESNLSERKGEQYKDDPEKILNVGYISEEKKELYCLVQWKQKNPKEKITNSIVPAEFFKIVQPDLLINYYETRLMFMCNKD